MDRWTDFWECGRDGLELQVPVEIHHAYKLGDPTKDFDALSPDEKQKAIVNLIDELPSVVRSSSRSSPFSFLPLRTK